MRAKFLVNLSLIGLAGTVAACSPKTGEQAASASAEAPMSAMEGMHDMSGMAMQGDAKTGTGVGTVTAIDTAAGTLTIDHEPIPAVGWPAMTMAFKANPPSLLESVKVGQKITFAVSVKGSEAEISSIH